MSSDTLSVAVAEAEARRKRADEQAAYYQAILRRGEELADAVRDVRFHAPDILPEYQTLCDDSTRMPEKLAGHVERWVEKFLDAGRRIATENLCASLAGGGEHNPFLPIALATYQAATEGDRQRVTRELQDVCALLLDKAHAREWYAYKDALGAVAERVCVAWNVRRDELQREQCPGYPRPYLESQQAQGEADPATPATSTPPAVTQQSEGSKPPADTSSGPPTRRAKRPVRKPEAEGRVAAVVESTAPDKYHELTARRMNKLTGVSIGMLPKLDAWQKLQNQKVGSVRATPLTEAMHALLSDTSADAADPAEAAAAAEVLKELLAFAPSDEARKFYEGLPPGDQYQMLEQLKADAAEARRRPRRERSDRS